MIKKFIILCMCLGLATLSIAQEKGKYVYVNAGGGLHSIVYNPTFGTHTGGFGYTLTAGYNYFINPVWGIGSGLGIQSYAAQYAFTGTHTINDIDLEGDAYQLRTYFYNWKEKQSLVNFDIPISIVYKKPISKQLTLLASAGGKLSIPVSAKYTTSGDSIESRGYYPQYNVELYNLPQYGFTTYKQSTSNSIDLQTYFSSTIKVGFIYAITKNIDMYAGIYHNYSLNSLSETNTKPLFMKGEYNSVLASNVVEKTKTSALGLEIGIQYVLQQNTPVFIPKVPVDTTVVMIPVADTIAKPVDTIAQVIDTVATVVDSMQIAPKDTIMAVIDTTNLPPLDTFVAADMISLPSELNVVKPVEPIKETPKVVVTIPEIVAVDTLPAKERAQKLASEIEFKYAVNEKYFIYKSQDDKIIALAEILKANPQLKLRIIGHTCDLNTVEYNTKLGQKRAVIVLKLFKEFGVKEAQLETDSKAASEPIVPNTSEENREINRRVELKVE